MKNQWPNVFLLYIWLLLPIQCFSTFNRKKVPFCELNSCANHSLYPPFWGMKSFFFLNITICVCEQRVKPTCWEAVVSWLGFHWHTKRLAEDFSGIGLSAFWISTSVSSSSWWTCCKHNPLVDGGWNNMETGLIQVWNNTWPCVSGALGGDWQAVKGEKLDPGVICFQSCEMASWNRREALQPVETCKYTLSSLD